MNRPNYLLALFAAPVLLLVALFGSLVLLIDTQNAAAGICGPAGPGVAIDPAGLPVGAVAGYEGEQLLNAAYVMNAAQALGLDARAQTIGVMTAMGESSLQVLDRGDAAGPDSRGLFQQRDNGAWGSYADRMDPTISSTNFYKALIKVDGWETLPPTIAAHRTQHNADPYHYEQHWDPAVQVVTALAGTDLPGVAPGTGGVPCTGATPSQISVDGWTKPAVGPITSHFGMRNGRPHNGTDIGAACETPIYAAAAGIVIQAGAADGYGNLIAIDHGGGIVTRYAHMYNNGLLTQVGAEVAAGQQIARVGDNGNSRGCHLHYEIRVRNDFIDPAPFMPEAGSPLG